MAAAGRSRGADLLLEVVPLRHRSAEQVLPLIRPLVPPPGSVGGTGGELVIRTTRANLAEIRRVLAALDRAPRRLLVTVRHDAAAADAAAGARIYGTRAVDADRHVQQLRVDEGGEARLGIGDSVPVTTHGSRRRTSRGRVVDEAVDAVEFRDMLTAVAVRPRLAGDTVTLEIETRRDMPGAQGPGSAELQRMRATVSGRLGEWIDVGTVPAGRGIEPEAAVHGTRAPSRASRRILVKVERLD
jgi:type II secretory pathway component GspD/PulD (secretin)